MFTGLNDMEIHNYKINEEIDTNVIVMSERVYLEDSGFGVYSVIDESRDSSIIDMKGVFPERIRIGSSIAIKGKILSYRNELQISIDSYRPFVPESEIGIIHYLRSLKGLKGKSDIIFKMFGLNSLQVIKNNPDALLSIKGIGIKTIQKLRLQILEMEESQSTLIFLLGLELSIVQARKLYKEYGEKIIQKVKDNPYFLCAEVNGFGFTTSDKLAFKLGITPNDQFRIKEGLFFTLNEATHFGHCYLLKEDLFKSTKKLLSESASNYFILDEELETAYAQLYYENRINNLDGKIYPARLYSYETVVSEMVQSLIIEYPFKNNNFAKVDIDNYLLKNNIQLEEKQRIAVESFTENKGGFFILNGSAGCGKTYTLKIILDILELKYKENRLPFHLSIFAPTGKAAKVATNSTGRECQTVHRGLGYGKDGFEYNEYNKLDSNCIVVDETSMLDISLTYHLLQAVDRGAKVILMGDTKQLASIGPGNVLMDIINSNAVKVVTLDVVKRQGLLSGIYKNALRIIEKKYIENCHDTGDAYVIHRTSSLSAQATIIESIKRLLNRDTFSLEDIQVLCPQKDGTIGVKNMNYVIQQEFNGYEPIKTESMLNNKFNITINGIKEERALYFKKGDKVIHIKNNYDKVFYEQPFKSSKVIKYGITNGETGIIEGVYNTEDDKYIIVNYDGQYVIYEDGFNELDHAFALTIHKSQGSQWKAILVPIMSENASMLDNNLFYTAYTRASEFIAIIGEQYSIQKAINTQKTDKRNTSLSQLLAS